MAENQRTYELLQEHWGQRIRAARGERTQTWLAEAIGVDQTTVSRIERGIYRLTPELMINIAVATETDPGDLYAFPPGLVSREHYEREIQRLKAGAA